MQTHDLHSALSVWDVSEAHFPHQGRPEEQLRFLLRYAILAPSNHNTQPWCFRVQGDSVEIFADYDRALPVADPLDRELTISCGAALFNLRTAMNYFGCFAEARPFPEPGKPALLARVSLNSPAAQDSGWSSLFKAITRRVTHRGAFERAAVPYEICAAIREAARVQGAWLATFASDLSRETLGRLIAQADRIQFDDPEFRRELADWLHAAHHNDGLPAYATGARELLGVLTPAVAFMVRTFDFGNGVAARDQEVAIGSPLLACLGTARDTVLDWLNAGQALQRVLLTLTAHGYHASFLNQPLEVPPLRPAVAALAEHTGHPQIILRIGRGGPAPRTPRRAVEQVLVADDRR